MNAYEVIKKFFLSTFGANAAPTVVTSSSAATATGNTKWVAFQAVSNDCVVSSITINGSAYTNFSAITLAQGQCIYGSITACTVSAGTGILYVGDLSGLN